MTYYEVSINRPQAGYRESFSPILVFDTAEEAFNTRDSLKGTFEGRDIQVSQVITGYEKRFMYLDRIQGPKLVELFNGQPKEATDMNPERRKRIESMDRAQLDSAMERLILKIETALENDIDLSANRVMELAGEWKGLKKGLGQYDEAMWQMLERTRGI